MIELPKYTVPTYDPRGLAVNERTDFTRRIPALPKVFFYIIMEEIYPELKGKAETGEFGYYLRCVVNKED